MTGLRPELSGVLTRRQRLVRRAARALGSDRRADRRDRAGARVRAAGDAGRAATSSPPTSSCSPSTARSCGRRPAQNGVQLRFEGAVAGVVPVIRVLQESLAGATIDRVHGIVNGTTNFILTEMARTGMTFEEALAEAQRLGYAEADPSEDVDGRDAAAKMAILARLAFDTPVHLDQVRYEGIEHDPARRPRVRARARPRAEADRHGRADRRRAVGARPPGVPLPGPSARVGQRAVQRGHGRVRGDHRDHDVRPGRRRAADRERGARRRDQRDDPAGLDAADVPACSRSSQDVVSAFYLHLEVADEPGVLAQVAQVLADAGRVGQVRRPAGPRRPGAPGDGRPPGARVAVRRGAGARSRSWRCCGRRRARSGCSRRSSVRVRR